jgi:hypothetical protein
VAKWGVACIGKWHKANRTQLSVTDWTRHWGRKHVPSGWWSTCSTWDTKQSGTQCWDAQHKAYVAAESVTAAPSVVTVTDAVLMNKAVSPCVATPILQPAVAAAADEMEVEDVVGETMQSMGVDELMKVIDGAADIFWDAEEGTEEEDDERDLQKNEIFFECSSLSASEQLQLLAQCRDLKQRKQAASCHGPLSRQWCGCASAPDFGPRARTCSPSASASGACSAPASAAAA